jgi:deazaflavin-dependent oxidoreductase (nitroreductase family)
MNEAISTEPKPAEITEYEDPDAPWNQAYDDGSITNWNDGVITEFRANQGRVGGAYAGGSLILLSTTGARSGRSHVVPLGPLYRDDIMYVSSFIEDRYPAWYFNVKANPGVSVELGTDTFHGTARALEGDEYAEFAGWVLEHNPLLADFQSKVSLAIPLVVITLDREN